MNINLLLLDVDGTLTIDRGNLALDPEAIRAIQRARGRVRIGLVTGNALIVAEALAKYIGLNDAPIIAENGCVVKAGSATVMLSTLSARDVTEELIKRLGLRPTYQYPCRYLDMTLDVNGDNYEVVEKIKNELIRMGVGDSYAVETSGYAIHVRPVECSKATAIKRLCELINVDCSTVAFIGDSDIDAEAFKVVGLGVAVGNATGRAREHAKLITRNPSGKGVAEFIELMLGEAH
ncbi:phosphoglycolate phosphatase [Caldivirga sp.]|jgi:phosphoglycolate phosphatase (TIGR01487 family)|uniref:phosphoglycolate phosphatase n=1 Tax=Caldivirga sp. TaxID=2080243 RepID=UPI003D09A198